MSSIPAFLNRIPRGLLDFFGIKTMGRYPQTLTEVLSATMDLQLWYIENALTRHRLISVAQNAPEGVLAVTWSSADPPLPLAAGGGIEVPENEVWLVRRYTMRWSMPETITTGEFGLGYQVQVGSGFAFMAYAASREGFRVGFNPGVGHMNPAGGLQALLDPWVLMPPASRPAFVLYGLEGSGFSTPAGNIELVRLLA